MKIIEKIINAFLVVQHKKIQVKNITFLDNGQGMFSGMSFDADVSLEFMYESAKAYSSCFCDIPFPGFHAFPDKNWKHRPFGQRLCG